MFSFLLFVQDAFGNGRLRAESQGSRSAYHSLLAKIGTKQIEEKIGYTFKEKSFLLQVATVDITPVDIIESVQGFS
jgi:hypothetical protein